MGLTLPVKVQYRKKQESRAPRDAALAHEKYEDRADLNMTIDGRPPGPRPGLETRGR